MAVKMLSMTVSPHIKANFDINNFPSSLTQLVFTTETGYQFGGGKYLSYDFQGVDAFGTGHSYDTFQKGATTITIDMPAKGIDWYNPPFAFVVSTEPLGGTLPTIPMHTMTLSPHISVDIDVTGFPEDLTSFTITCDAGWVFGGGNPTFNIIGIKGSATSNFYITLPVGKTSVVVDIGALGASFLAKDIQIIVPVTKTLVPVKPVFNLDISGVSINVDSSVGGIVPPSTTEIVFTAKAGFYLGDHLEVRDKNQVLINVNIPPYTKSFTYQLPQPLAHLTSFIIDAHSIKFINIDRLGVSQFIEVAPTGSVVDNIKEVVFKAKDGYFLGDRLRIEGLAGGVQHATISPNTKVFKYVFNAPIPNDLKFLLNSVKDLTGSAGHINPDNIKFFKVDVTGLSPNILTNLIDPNKVIQTLTHIEFIATKGFQLTGELIVTGLNGVGVVTRILIPAGATSYKLVLFPYLSRNIKVVLKTKAKVKRFTYGVNLYELDNTDLQALTNELPFKALSKWWQPESGFTTFLFDLYKIPFSVAHFRPPNKEHIIGGYEVKLASAYVISEFILNVDVGVISVIPKYNNAYDFKVTHAKLHLPFVNEIFDLDIGYLMGEKLSINYKVDLFNGDMLIELKSTATNEIFQVFKVNVKYKVPIFMQYREALTNQPENFLLSGLLRAYVEVFRPVPYRESRGIGCIPYLYKSFTCAILGTLHGLNYIENLQLDSLATYEEKKEIDAILLSGVIL